MARRPHGTRGRHLAESWSPVTLCVNGTGLGRASSFKLCWFVGRTRSSDTGGKDGHPRGHAWSPPYGPHERLASLRLGLFVRGRGTVTAGVLQGCAQHVSSEAPGTFRVPHAVHSAPTPGDPVTRDLRSALSSPCSAP